MSAVRAGCFVLIVLVAAGCRSGHGAPEVYRLPAEWEPHEAVWVSFLGGPMDEPVYEIVRVIAAHTPVVAVVPGTHREAYAVEARLGTMGVDPGRVEVVSAERIVQTRDVGPIFLLNGAGDLRIVDFRWNNYGEPDALHEGYRDSYPFDSLTAARLGIPVVKSRVAMEGGALEVNGKGTLLQVEAVTLQRNPGLSKDVIEEELKRVLGQEKIIWLKQGPADDPHRMTLIADGYLGQGVGGHVDEFARFANATTILLAFPDSADAAADPVKRITYDRMQENFEILRAATDQDGRPFDIVKVPVPNAPYTPMVVDSSWTHPVFRAVLERHPGIRHGDTLRWVPASSYLNYFVTNEVVLVPAYWEPGMPPSVKERDERFRAIMERYFPDRKVVSIPSMALNMNGGGIHCWTQQQPLSQRAAP